LEVVWAPVAPVSQTWLDQAHQRLDGAVHAAYGWPYPLRDEEVLERLLALNLSRSEQPETAITG
jgi:hypothetical protein